MARFYTLFLLLIPISLCAQVTISGRVLNQADTKPVANVSVFLNSTTIGYKTTEGGKFKLSNVMPGKYRLVVSIVGFETYKIDLVVADRNISLGDITLFSKAINLKEVSIKPDQFRGVWYDMFKEQFLGDSDQNRGSTILNPDVLSLGYSDSTNTLTASSSDYLVIENADLGYNVKYMLDDFTAVIKHGLAYDIQFQGTVFFEEMKGTPNQQRRWKKRRQEVYEGSQMHFFRSLIHSTLDEDGFRALQLAYFYNPARFPDSLIVAKIKKYSSVKTNVSKFLWKDSLAYWIRNSKVTKTVRKLMPYPLNKGDLFRPTDQPGLYAIGCDSDGIYVTYSKDHRFPSVPNINHMLSLANSGSTLISFNSPYAIVDRNGIIANPYGISFDGVWAKNRIARLLPSDYEETVSNEAPLDSTVARNINIHLRTYDSTHVVEKVYLHFDKPYYAAGDTMYFKAYLTMGGRHQPSALSGVLYANLINTANQVEKSIKLQVTDGVAWGNFVLPDTLNKANYRVRAYTQWMRNDGEKDFFMQTVPVASVLKAKIPESIVAQKEMPNKPDIQFLPEGGSLVAGIRSKIAFKAINGNGSGIDVKGEIVDNENKQVCLFTSAHLGMGYFYLVPQEGKTYKAKVTYTDGTQNAVDLPAPAANGIVLAVNNDSSAAKAFIRIIAGKSYYQANHNKDFTLAIYSGGVATNFICKLDSTVVALEIFKRELFSGVATATLFSPSGEPLCERLLFIQNHDQLSIGLSSDKTTYAKREHVNINLNASHDNGAAALGHFSVAVLDDSKVPVDENAENTILTNLLLTSDLKGYVEQPNYYFSDPEPEAVANLDLLMLTQGYRRFEWTDLLTDHYSAMAYKPQKGLELDGTLKTPAGKPVANGRVTLFSGKQQIAMQDSTGSNGDFKFRDLVVTDTAKLVLRATKANSGNDIKIEINRSDVPPVAKPVSSQDNNAVTIAPATMVLMQTDYEKNQDLRKKTIVLNQVNIKSVKPNSRPVLLHSTNLNGAGQADQVIMGDALDACPVLKDCLTARMQGILLQNGQFYTSRSMSSIRRGHPPMAIIIDGITYDQSSDPLSTISSGDIYSIEILESPMYLGIYGSTGIGGIILITTKRGDEGVQEPAGKPAGLITYNFNGFQKAREFYSPKYDQPNDNTSIPDLRSTIYWNPEVTTDKDGNASFNYYNADGAGSYRVVIEGIDKNGDVGRKVYRYKVE